MQGGLGVRSQSKTASCVIVDFWTELQYEAGFKGRRVGLT